MKLKTLCQSIADWHWKHGAKTKYKIFILKDMCFYAPVLYFFAERHLGVDISSLYSLLFSSFSTSLAFIFAGLPILLGGGVDRLSLRLSKSTVR